MKIAIYAACLLLLLLALLLICGCTKAEEQNNMGNAANKTVTFINGIRDADIWILPRTEANLKTTLWGTATVSKTKAGESCLAPLCEPGDDGLYLFRMIDTSHFYYSASEVVLEDGWTMELKGEDLNSIVLEVTDETGTLKGTYEVFAARL